MASISIHDIPPLMNNEVADVVDLAAVSPTLESESHRLVGRGRRG